MCRRTDSCPNKVHNSRKACLHAFKRQQGNLRDPVRPICSCASKQNDASVQQGLCIQVDNPEKGCVPCVVMRAAALRLGGGSLRVGEDGRDGEECYTSFRVHLCTRRGWTPARPQEAACGVVGVLRSGPVRNRPLCQGCPQSRS